MDSSNTARFADDQLGIHLEPDIFVVVDEIAVAQQPSDFRQIVRVGVVTLTFYQHTGPLVTVGVVDADLQEVGIFENRPGFIPTRLGIVGVRRVEGPRILDFIPDIPTIGSIGQMACIVLEY